MKTIEDVMTRDPACCTPDDTVSNAARQMADRDIGAIPVLESRERRRLVGMITDRDIACRVVAKEKDPKQTRVRDAMTEDVVSVKTDASLDDCCGKMKDHQIRRIPVVDRDGACRGIVSQADIARAAPEADAGGVVRDVSKPTEKARQA